MVDELVMGSLGVEAWNNCKGLPEGLRPVIYLGGPGWQTVTLVATVYHYAQNDHNCSTVVPMSLREGNVVVGRRSATMVCN